MTKVELYLYTSQEHLLYANFATLLEQMRNAEQQDVTVVAPATPTKKSSKKTEPVKDERQLPLLPEPTPVETKPASEEPTPGVIPITAAPSHSSNKVTRDDAVSAIRVYFTKHGPAAARELLLKHGVNRVGELPDDKLAAFVAEASV